MLEEALLGGVGAALGSAVGGSGRGEVIGVLVGGLPGVAVGATGGLCGRDIETSYVELPVLGKLRGPGMPVVTPTVVAGPTVGANVQSSQRGTATDWLGNEQELSSDQPPFDADGMEAGLLLGLGLELDAGGLAVSASGRYQLGPTDISGGESGLNLGPSRGFSVTAGVAF